MGVLTGGLCFWSVFRLDVFFTEAAFLGDAVFEVRLLAETALFFVVFFLSARFLAALFAAVRFFGVLFPTVRFSTDGFFLAFGFFPAVRFFGALFLAVFFFTGDFFEIVDARELDFEPGRVADFAGFFFVFDTDIGAPLTEH